MLNASVIATKTSQIFRQNKRFICCLVFSNQRSRSILLAKSLSSKFK